jgi:hypothetical protein
VVVAEVAEQDHTIQPLQTYVSGGGGGAGGGSGGTWL